MKYLFRSRLFQSLLCGPFFTVSFSKYLLLDVSFSESSLSQVLFSSLLFGIVFLRFSFRVSFLVTLLESSLFCSPLSEFFLTQIFFSNVFFGSSFSNRFEFLGAFISKLFLSGGSFSDSSERFISNSFFRSRLSVGVVSFIGASFRTLFGVSFSESSLSWIFFSSLFFGPLFSEYGMRYLFSSRIF